MNKTTLVGGFKLNQSKVFNKGAILKKLLALDVKE